MISAIKNPGKKTLKGGQEMDQRSQDSVHDPAVNSMGFILAFYISELELKEPTTWNAKRYKEKTYRHQ